MKPETLIRKQLDEAHAMESALVTNLQAHITLTTDNAYKAILERHLRETRDHVKAVTERRNELGGGGSNPIEFVTAIARDVIGQALVLTKGPIDVFRTASSTERMLKNARDEAATEALEIATYDALEATAKAAGDTKTAKLAADHRKQEERMLADLRSTISRLATRTYEDRTGKRASTPPQQRPGAAKPRATSPA